MKLLLDTHIWIWSIAQRDSLARRVERTLAADDAELWLSPISTWEFLLLFERGRLTSLQLGGEPDKAVAAALGAGPFREAPLTHTIARASRQVSLPHDDPADRFLVATARVLGLTLVTADTRLIAAKACAVLPNR